MKQRRNREQQLRIKSVDPRRIDQHIGFMVAVARARAVKLRTLQIVKVRIIRNLVVILTQCGYKAKLIGRIHIEDQRPETSIAVVRVVYDLRDRRL